MDSLMPHRRELFADGHEGGQCNGFRPRRWHRLPLVLLRTGIGGSSGIRVAGPPHAGLPGEPQRDRGRTSPETGCRPKQARKRSRPSFLGRDLAKKKAATYSPALHCSTIGAGGLNFSVRNGKRWDPAAITT